MKRRFWIASSVLLAIGIALALWVFWIEPRSLVVKKQTLRLRHWPSDTPLRIAILADLHVGSPFNGLGKLETIVAKTNDLNPDVVVLLGDYVVQGVKGGEFVAPERIAEELERLLRSPLGTFAILGNHDWWQDPLRVKRALESAGIHVIDDSSTRLSIGTQTFHLVGVSDFLEGKHDVDRALSNVLSDDPTILITHNPDVFPSVPPRVLLTLAGHTHGGQVALPILGRPIIPSLYGERYAVGHVKENDKNLFVSSGLGTSILPIRFRVPPEIVLLTVERAN